MLVFINVKIKNKLLIAIICRRWVTVDVNGHKNDWPYNLS